MKLDRVGVARRNQLLQCLAPADFDLLAPHLKDVSLHQGDILAEPAALVENVLSFRKSYPRIAMMQSRQNGRSGNLSVSLDRSTQRRILVQR